MREISGCHLVIDGYVKNSFSLTPDYITDLMDELVIELDMQYLQRPTAIRVSLDENRLDGEEDEGGWSVFAQITTSHIAVHGWPLRRAVMMDISSCKDFDFGRAIALIQRKMDLECATIWTLKRRDPYSFEGVNPKKDELCDVSVVEWSDGYD